MAADRNLKSFYSSNGADARSLQYTSSSAESCAPTQETSEFGGPHPCAKPYATAAEAQMWTAVEMLKELEVKLRPIYDGLGHRKLTQDERESLEQQNKIMQAQCESILETVKNIEKKIPDQPAAEDVELPSLNQPACEVLPEVLLVPVDDPYAFNSVQLGGQPTCAFVVSMSDHYKIKRMMEIQKIHNCCYHVRKNKLEGISHMSSTTAPKVHKFPEGWPEDDSEIVHSKIAEENNNKENEESTSTGLWNVVTGILSKADDGGLITVKIKDVKEAYQQQQQLNNELMQLNSIISDCNNLLAEKDQAIKHLKGMLDDASGHLQTEQGQVTELIGHHDRMLTFLTRKLPDAAPMAENTKPGGNVQPQQTLLRDAEKLHFAASNQDSKLDNRPRGNHSLIDARKGRQMNSIVNPIIVTDAITLEDTYNSLSEMKLESACHGGDESPKTLTKKKDEASPKSPKKVNLESHIPSKTEAKSQPTQKSKSTSKSIAKSSTDSPKTSVVTSTDNEGEHIKQLDSGDEIHDLKSSKRSDSPNKPKSQNHDNLSKSDDDNKLGTPV